MNSDEAVRAGIAKTDKAHKRRVEKKKKKIQKRSVVSFVNYFLSMADLPPEVWTGKLHGQVKNFIKQEHDGDEDAAVDEIEAIFEGWPTLMQLMRKYRISPVPSFHEFYLRRRKIRGVLAGHRSHLEVLSDYKEVKL